jgi:hypothetical protein
MGFSFTMVSDKNIDVYLGLKPAKFGYLRSFKLTYQLESEGFGRGVLVVCLSNGLGAEAIVLRLEFRGVTDLKLGHIQGVMKYWFQIQNVREDQLEGINYRVVESEYELCAFYCSEFSARVIKEAEKDAD